MQIAREKLKSNLNIQLQTYGLCINYVSAYV